MLEPASGSHLLGLLDGCCPHDLCDLCIGLPLPLDGGLDPGLGAELMFEHELLDNPGDWSIHPGKLLDEPPLECRDGVLEVLVHPVGQVEHPLTVRSHGQM